MPEKIRKIKYARRDRYHRKKEDDIATTRASIENFRMTELISLMKSFGLPFQGRKKHLTKTAVDILIHGHPEIKPRAYKVKVRQLIAKSEMENKRELPPRKHSVSTKNMKQPSSPLQTLLQMGFQRHRAEKALATTGNRSAQLAADWLLAHVNDPDLDSSEPREYILYATPSGDFLRQLEIFWERSLAECGWNEAHNYFPHITVISFFKAPNECAPQLSQALDDTIHSEMKGNIGEHFKLESYTSPNYVGLFVPEDEFTILKTIASKFVKEVSDSIVNDNYEQMDAIATCFPWCTNATSRFSVLPKNVQSISLGPHVKSLHLTLANQFPTEHFEKLKQLAEEIIPYESHSSYWFVKLYSRDPSCAGKQVYKVIYSHVPRDNDELELRNGDYIYVNEDAVKNSVDGWVEGTSWLTGCSGYFPINYTKRTAESDAWTLHKTLALYDMSGVFDLNTHSLSTLDILTNNTGVVALDNPSTTVVVQSIDTSKQDEKSPDIYIMRHGERVDILFGNWIPLSFVDGKYVRRDLNMPSILPQRRGYPGAFRIDSPITNVGALEAKLTGEDMTLSKVTFGYVYSSPALRSVQTCHNVLSSMGLEEKLRIRIEPALFEWLAWYIDDVPDFMTLDELETAGFNVDKSYKPMLSVDQLKKRDNETCTEYYERCNDVVTRALEMNHDGGNIFIVAHASTLDTCSRMLIGLPARNERNMDLLMALIPYCSLVKVSKKKDKWELVDSNLLGICHSTNRRFDWHSLLLEEFDEKHD